MSDQKPWERAAHDVMSGLGLYGDPHEDADKAGIRNCIKRACEEYAAPLVEALDEWARLAEHLKLSTSGHRQRTRELLARYRAERGDRD